MMQVTTGPLNDPLLVQGRTELEEDAIALGCITGSTHSRKDIEQLRLFPAVHPCGREGTSWKQYLEMPLCDIDSPVRMASRYDIIVVIDLSYLELIFT